MAVVSMQRVRICALKKDRKAILEALQRKGVIEISDETTGKASKDSCFTCTNVADFTEQMQAEIKLTEQALEVLNEYAPEKKSLFAGLNGKAEMDASDYDSFVQKKAEANRAAKRLVTLEKSILEAKATNRSTAFRWSTLVFGTRPMKNLLPKGIFRRGSTRTDSPTVFPNAPLPNSSDLISGGILLPAGRPACTRDLKAK